MKSFMVFLLFVCLGGGLLVAQSDTCSLIPGVCLERAQRLSYAAIDQQLGRETGYQQIGYTPYVPSYGPFAGPMIGGNIGGVGGVGIGGVGIGNVGIGIGGRITRDLLIGSAGAGIGYAVGGTRGAIIGGVAGIGIAELGGYIANRRAGNGNLVAGASYSGSGGDVYYGNTPCEKPKASRKERVTCAQQQAAQANAVQQAELERQTVSATRWLFNRSGQEAIVTDGDHIVCASGRCFMRPGENWQVDRPASGQWSVALQVPKGAGISNVPGEVRSIGAQGWEVVAPKEVQ